MITGFNHNIKYKNQIYHVQTEDSGLKNPHIITHVFVGGNIIASRKSEYADLVASMGAEQLGDAVRTRMEEQHKAMLRSLIHGKFDNSANVANAHHLSGPAPLNVDAEVFARTAAHADNLAVIRSMWTDIPAHEVATVFMNTGSLRLAKPSMGSWVVYGLGTENQNLPGFIALRGGRLPPGGATNYQAAFLPGVYQGASINTQAPTVQQMIQNIRNNYVGKAEQRRQLDFVHQLNELHAQNLQRDAALETRLESYEIAFRMQAEATDAFDLTKESAETKAAYGNKETGRQLLVARRLVERGVRFVQVWHQGWDHHQKLEDRLRQKAGEIDQPLAALLQDLKQRGLLDSTLVVWGGEFGRTNYSQGKLTANDYGRDHHPRCFSMWMAGGGIKGGSVHGETCPFGYNIVKDGVRVRDFHATILHLLGIDHERLSYKFQGLDARLTGVEESHVLHDILT